MRVDDVAAAILVEVGPLEAMKLQKLLYYCQAWNLAITDEPMFDDDIEAWSNGPVVRSAWQSHRGRRNLRQWSSGDPERLPAAVRRLVAVVCTEYGCRSGDELSLLTHGEAPWVEARAGLPPAQPSDAKISRETMARFYRKHRTLGGRLATDLAVGGVYPVNRPAPKFSMLEIRDTLRRAPKTAPADTPVIGRGQFEALAGVNLDGINRARSRTRDN
jgi:uncharacterized phage-associated protein